MNPDEKGYNGWTNHETWAANLWLTNEQGTDDACLDMAKDAIEDHGNTPKASHILADAIREMVEEDNPLTTEQHTASMYSDLLTSALQAVDWREIAEHYLEAAQEIIDDEEKEWAEGRKA